jgi:hypothetical protein
MVLIIQVLSIGDRMVASGFERRSLRALFGDGEKHRF